MINKPVTEMTWTELHAELTRAVIAKQAAEYQDGNAMRDALFDAAVKRVAAVNAEIDKRIEATRLAGKAANG